MLLGASPEFEGSRQAAQNVFDAKTSAHVRRGGSWTVLAGLPLLLLVFAVGGYYYWLSLAPRSIVVDQKPPSESAASTVQSADLVEPPALQPLAPQSTGQIALPQTNTSLVEEAAPIEAELDSYSEPSTEPAVVTEQLAQTGEAPASGDLSPTLSSQGDDANAAQRDDMTTDALTSEQMPSADTSDATKDPSIGRAQGSSVASAALRPQNPAAIEQIKISRQTKPNQIHPLLTRAYAAFQSGDDSVAMDAYTKVLLREPTNRDAVLGLAAVAVRDERYVEASEWYLKLLTLNPADALAQAALIDLQRNLDPSESETRLKLLLDRQPKAAYLYFSLGNVLASQSRWAEAETAYFNALRYEGFNPDYAFNLAVSLDHLGQRDAALTYYRRALEMSEQQPAEFQPATVWQRIHAMAESVAAE